MVVSLFLNGPAPKSRAVYTLLFVWCTVLCVMFDCFPTRKRCSGVLYCVL